MIPLRLTLLATILLLSIPAIPAQQRLAFEVASIHPSRAETLNGGIKALPEGAGYTAQNVTIQLMISLMYKVANRQILNAPAWLNSERFNVEAKADKPGYSVDDLHTMYQNLLADRLNLKFHLESKEGNIYALKLDKAGLRMTPNLSPQDYRIPINFTPEGVTGTRVPMPYLCWFLSQNLQADQRPVVNLTGLTANYDFTLSFAPVLPPDVPVPPEVRDRPTLFEALRQQLGLTLTPQRGPVEYLVIDHIDRPSEN